MWNLRSVAAAPDLQPTGQTGDQARPTTIRLAASCSDPIGRPVPELIGRRQGPFRDGAATTGGDPIGRPGPDPIGRPQADPVGCLHQDPLACLVTSPDLTQRMDEVMEGATAGDPMSAVKWSRKSTRTLSRVLRISHTKAWRMLRRAKYRLRFNRKRLTRRSSPDRSKQFANINKLKKSFEDRGQPVISVDAKKRELVGLFKNQGRAWRKAPVDVDMYDFPSDADGVAIPYGIYDVTRGDGFVVVGTSHNTPAFATHAVHTWWRRVGRTLYSTAKELLILADSGSSNGARASDWKHGLQEIANKTGLRITVAHYPTGASKWNPVEHRLFGPISINWAGEPLVDYNTICQRIRHTRTRSGARCRVALDRRTWLTKAEQEASGTTVAEPPSVKIRHSRVVPRLNYTISPRLSPRE